MAWASGRYKTFQSGSSFTAADANAIQDMFIRSAGLETADFADDVPLFPLGTVLPYAGAAAPNANWLLAQGQAISRATYADLFTLLNGQTPALPYGVGDGSTTFNLPDLRDRVPVSKGVSSVSDTLGETGGATSVTLTSAEMAAHAHNGQTGTESANHYHPINYDTPDVTAGGSTALIFTPDAASLTNDWGFASADHSHTFTTGAAGGGTAHENMQPYIVLNYIVRVL